MDIEAAVNSAALKKHCVYVLVESVNAELNIAKHKCARLLLQAYRDGLLRKRQKKFATVPKSAFHGWSTSEDHPIQKDLSDEICQAADKECNYCVLSDNSYVDFKGMMLYHAAK